MISATIGGICALLSYRIAIKRGCEPKSQFWWVLLGFFGSVIGLWLTWKHAGKDGGLARVGKQLLGVLLGLMVSLLLGSGLKSCFSGFGAEGMILGNCEHRIKNEMKDPSSYKYISHTMLANGISIKFRGKNSFGAYVTDSRFCSK